MVDMSTLLWWLWGLATCCEGCCDPVVSVDITRGHGSYRHDLIIQEQETHGLHRLISITTKKMMPSHSQLWPGKLSLMLAKTLSKDYIYMPFGEHLINALAKSSPESV